ncbi:lanthionine synthetase C family protein [Streptomyces mayonensis]|uniref:lanthionine synthetase C family protein n=1 Tax=Streptomyces mayonensis TaxID=2750816 RepID=UPI001C1E7D82|nr:lanthionine synthetase C family protein [Streptomyces sp. A108]MBU6529676.1 lanthionine synthetase C family protein [Streptomyces sp. A108]
MTTAPPAKTELSTRQSIAHGPLGTVLLAIESARRERGTWQDAHQALQDVSGPLISGDDANLFLGAPAMAYALHLAADGTDRYTGALATLDNVVAEHAKQRTAAAHARIDAGHCTTFAEYDLFRGLTGIGALLLLRHPESPALREVLEYLVRLTEPLTVHGTERLGWWVEHSPGSDKTATPGGHANAGLAHGITGPLALLALAMRAGVTVDGHESAIRRICRWLDEIRIINFAGLRWPRWLTTNGPAPTNPIIAPSWCYGTPGQVRAQQLAAIVLGDDARKRIAERSLRSCLIDPVQLDTITDRGLCHGFGGLLRTVQRVAQDADQPDQFTGHIALLTHRFMTAPAPTEGGFLEGRAGAALAFQDAESGTEPEGRWDACLLLV